MADKPQVTHLQDETSPYLQQHIDNPVEWYPWCAEALERAKAENKPILLSIGYTACHWCHVMAHESFEDEETAQYMNEHFINIKVDREERPDIDKVYQMSHHLLTKLSGGWPLTMFLNPEDGVPFFGGTYFPKEGRFGLKSFKAVLQDVIQCWQDQQLEITQQNLTLKAVLTDLSQIKGAIDSRVFEATPLLKARDELLQQFDAVNGGFGEVPKFAHPNCLDFLLRYWHESVARGAADNDAAIVVETTLTKLAYGGLFDHIGGGFCRYSVDNHWEIPHFEKMLYDNALLLSTFSNAYAATGNNIYKKVCNETADWVLQQMRSKEGGFYSTLDADSDGEEGAYYVWTKKEVEALLGEKEYAVFCKHYNLNKPANFGRTWHLHVETPLPALAVDEGTDEVALEKLLQSIRLKLLATRQKRSRPQRDEKVNTAWNGLLMKGLVEAGVQLQRSDLIAAAFGIFDHIQKNVFVGGRLLATYKDNRAHYMAYLDDYAFVLEGLLALLQVEWRDDVLQLAVSLGNVLLAHYYDEHSGGFYFTAHDHEKLIQRPKQLMDEATPAGNGVAAMALNRLGLLLAREDFLQAAQRTLVLAWFHIQQAPSAHCTLLQALDEVLEPPTIVILSGQDDVTLGKWRRRIAALYRPGHLCFVLPKTAKNLPLGLQDKVFSGPAQAILCQGAKCSAPLETEEDLVAALTGKP